jgi:trehalose 6-phosphate phosphatase
MRHVFECWNEIADRLSGAGKIALFLDFDGTLARIRPRPEEVLLHGSTRRALAVLARSPRFRVSVISGRKYSDIRTRIRVPGIHYLGLYGWDNGSGEPLTEKSRSLLACVKSMLGGALVNNPGVWIEDKDQIVAVHYRNEPYAVLRGTRELLRHALQGFDDHLRIAAGKNVLEIVPRELEDKGAAVRRELAASCCHATPVYAGDDLSDEPAFAALRHGITIHVGRIRRTKAHFRLADASEVRMFLERVRAGFANHRL